MQVIPGVFSYSNKYSRFIGAFLNWLEQKKKSEFIGDSTHFFFS